MVELRLSNASLGSLSSDDVKVRLDVDVCRCCRNGMSAESLSLSDQLCWGLFCSATHIGLLDTCYCCQRTCGAKAKKREGSDDAVHDGVDSLDIVEVGGARIADETLFICLLGISPG